MAREAVPLHRALAAAGIEIMDLKGAPPAALAYGELGLKESADIDHLAAPAAVVDATHVLVELGYEISFPLEDRELARLVQYGEETTLPSSQTAASRLTSTGASPAIERSFPVSTCTAPLRMSHRPDRVLRTGWSECLSELQLRVSPVTEGEPNTTPFYALAANARRTLLHRAGLESGPRSGTDRLGPATR